MKCCLCQKEIVGYGNNAEPVMNGRCCNDCNANIIIPNRLNHMKTLKDAAIAQANFEHIMNELNGYQVQTTLYGDFTIADAFGKDAVIDTYNRVFNEWKYSNEFMTELALVLNHKIWEHHSKNNPLMVTYDTLWKQQDQWCMTALDDEGLKYYIEVTD